VPEALDWIETETARLIAFQQEDGTVERWYGDGNWARTLLLYAMMKTQGAFLDGWQEGVRLGAVREGDRLLVSLEAPPAWKGRLRFDHARHRRDLNFARDYVRLNEWTGRGGRRCGWDRSWRTGSRCRGAGGGLSKRFRLRRTDGPETESDRGYEQRGLETRADGVPRHS
jgi:hypothetical protein